MRTFLTALILLCTSWITHAQTAQDIQQKKIVIWEADYMLKGILCQNVPDLKKLVRFSLHPAATKEVGLRLVPSCKPIITPLLVRTYFEESYVLGTTEYILAQVVVINATTGKETLEKYYVRFSAVEAKEL